MASQPKPPDGFIYTPDIIDEEAESALVERISELRLKPFEFQGYEAKRRVISYGWHYNYAGYKLEKVDELPEFLLPLRSRIANIAGLSAAEFSHALVTEYTPGTPIGWHCDRGVFAEVAGVSLVSACNFRFRRKAVVGWDRYTCHLEPRSAYIMRGPSRTEWEHSIPEVDELRYSITFRTMRPKANRSP